LGPAEMWSDSDSVAVARVVEAAADNLHVVLCIPSSEAPSAPPSV